MRQIDLIKLYSAKRCLVVDDSPDIRVALSGMLRVFGVQHVDAVANGEQAIEACNALNYDLVLCDYNLGGGSDGQQVLEELRYRQRLKNTSIFVMVTAESSREMVLGALEYQPDDYITKPITQTILRQRLDRVLMRHEELYGIKLALDEKNFEAAESRCQDRLSSNTRYRGACLQIQAEMNLRLSKLDTAESIYKGVLAERAVLWAKLGLGKTQVAKKEFKLAEKNLRDVINTDRRVVEAHDLMADSYMAQGDSVNAQKYMQTAAQVSPKSVQRQRRLATLALSNNDTEVFLETSRRVIKTARNSCFESADDYFNLANKLTELSAGDQASNKYVKETFEVLQRLEKKPFFDVSANIQTNSIKSRSFRKQKKNDQADVFLDKAKSLYHKANGEVSAEAGLDIVKALIEIGDKKAADQMLQELAEKYPENVEFLERVDALSDTPKSKHGHKKVADMTKVGVEFYEEEKFKDAINVFKKALSIFSGHVGLNLNLVQSIVAESKKNGIDLSLENTCREALNRISDISEEDPQYARYQYLNEQVSGLFV